ncbi:hypothetical protein [Methylobacterium sp. Leaf456]|uniref:hypothetical protein n=1 Tax=Methylobacterium sp. Leaf456 TaxID=1736382 RepID=UPI0025705E75|nr:hypothetical protein [Methylobacterium sp. Leaf456]
MRRCLRKVDEAAATADPALAAHIREALGELEAAYARPSERIVALEALLHEFGRGHSAGNTLLARLLRVAVDRRQGTWSHRARVRGMTQAPRLTASLQATAL